MPKLQVRMEHWIRWPERYVCVLGCVCARRSEAGVSGEKGQVSSTADECRSYISSRPPQTPEQWVSASPLHKAPSPSSSAAISLLKVEKAPPVAPS